MTDTLHCDTERMYRDAQEVERRFHEADGPGEPDHHAGVPAARRCRSEGSIHVREHIQSCCCASLQASAEHVWYTVARFVWLCLRREPGADWQRRRECLPGLLVRTLLCICNTALTRSSFIFTLQEFSKELIALVDALERLYAAEHERASSVRRWQWLRDAISISGPQHRGRAKRGERSLSKRFCTSLHDLARRFTCRTHMPSSHVLYFWAETRPSSIPQNPAPRAQYHPDSGAIRLDLHW